MPVTNVEKNPGDLTMRITCEFDAPVDRVWQTWADPRQLEQWWGPPDYPATVVDHDLTQGARVSYYMTGSDGNQHHGWWQIVAIDAPHRLEFQNGFAENDGTVSTDLPSMLIEVELTAQPGDKTVMAVVTTFPTLAAMTQVLAMGHEEGTLAALGQIDAMFEGVAIN